jgi:hypothetical protein
MAAHAKTAGVSVTWDAPSHAVILRVWGFVEGETLRASCNEALQLLSKMGSKRLITDSLEIKPLTQADQRWVDEDWRPRAQAAGLRRNAILVPKSAVAQLTMNAVVRRFDEVQFGYFSELAEAREWLKQS